MRCALLLLALGISTAIAQDPCKLEFENEWVRISRVTYPPYGKSKTHAHPVTPTVYVYTTDGGPIRFRHAEGFSIDRPAVKAGAIRFNRGMVEQHDVESLSDIPSEYIRIELKTDPLELPARDIRIPPAEDRGFENAQIRIEKLTCEPHQKCGSTDLPSVAVNLNDRTAAWVANGSTSLENTTGQTWKLVRIVLKSVPPGP
jgi:hypothetical protein